jgi:hypothetical protein
MSGGVGVPLNQARGEEVPASAPQNPYRKIGAMLHTQDLKNNRMDSNGLIYEHKVYHVKELPKGRRNKCLQTKCNDL